MKRIKEADITINGRELTQVESATLRQSLLVALNMFEHTAIGIFADGHLARLRVMIAEIDETETAL